MAVTRTAWSAALVAAAIVASVAASVGCTPTGATGSTGSAGEALVQEKCSICHTLDRVNQAKKDKAGWVATVDRMRGKGALLTDAEAQQVVDYLSTK